MTDSDFQDNLDIIRGELADLRRQLDQMHHSPSNNAIDRIRNQINRLEGNLDELAKKGGERIREQIKHRNDPENLGEVTLNVNVEFKSTMGSKYGCILRQMSSGQYWVYSPLNDALLYNYKVDVDENDLPKVLHLSDIKGSKDRYYPITVDKSSIPEPLIKLIGQVQEQRITELDQSYREEMTEVKKMVDAKVTEYEWTIAKLRSELQATIEASKFISHLS